MSVSTINVGTTGNPAIDPLLAGTRWESASLTYGFPTAASSWDGYAAGSEPFSGFTSLTPDQQRAVAAAVATWAAVANVTLTPVSEPQQTADIRYAGTDKTASSHAYYPYPSPMGGDVWMGPRLTGEAQWTPGSYAFMTAVHETGHALGLKHPHDDSSGVAAAPEADSVELSVMSYRSYPGATLTRGYTLLPGSYPAGPMLDDIAAVQDLYGANYATNAGDTVYRFTPDQGIVFQTIWDGGGTDTYDLSAYASGVTVDLRPGAWSTFAAGQLARLDGSDPSRLARGNVANAFLYNDDPRSLIENAVTGSGNDLLIGNAAANRLDGGAGDDTLSGGGGDTLIGGAGNDRAELAGGVATVVGVETVVGSAGSDWLTLGDGGQTLILAGIETLVGGGGPDAVTLGNRGNTLILAGIETLTGGSGQDLVLLGNRGNTMSVSGVDALVGGANTDDVTVTSGRIQFDGRGGADVLTLSGAAESDLILFGSADDGATAGQGAGFDVERNFQPGIDQILVLGGLRTLVDGNGDGQPGRAVRGGGTVDLRTDELVQLTTLAGALNDAGFAGLRSALGRVATDGAARSALVLASDGYNGALYVVSDDGDGAIAASEVRMLARFDGVMPAIADVRLA